MLLFCFHSVPGVPQLKAVRFSLNNGPDVSFEVKTTTEVIQFSCATFQEQESNHYYIEKF